MAGLTTHILDLTHGTPASNVIVELFFQEANRNSWKKIKVVKTNSDGRLDAPLLTREEMKIGSYELIFHVGVYFREKEIALPDPPFLEAVPVRFGVSNIDKDYHVPLLISPWGYQVYRGS
ncbi:hydroxyisourate hydrolase [Cytobacillus kochii]|uniref:hydroxyisourate hydrolase n=1 Tax=Cytobacillus kochii TaxID=859143 RepID=UPI002E200960|nr:hydroxyisourate hydrolase [Cytobacillus kochii]MED1605232.1 hydroxyisourate hydrolase [Cytobacillus kochii]